MVRVAHQLAQPCRVSLDWICVCEDLEERSQVHHRQASVSGVAWAPLMARKAECIAVARGSTVRLLSLGGQLQGHINANENLQVYQVRRTQCFASSLVEYRATLLLSLIHI